MRPEIRLLVLVMIVLVTGCKPPPKIDSEIVTSLKIGIRETCAAMGEDVPPDRALNDHAGLLAIQSDPKRQAAIRNGEIMPLTLQRQMDEVMADLEKFRPELKAPKLMVYLVSHPNHLTVDQMLLVDALASQVQREAHLNEKKSP